MKVAAMTLGAHGALARADGQVSLFARFRGELRGYDRARETYFTGPSAMLFCKAWGWREALDFSNAMAALNCTALGARGGIRGVEEVRAMMARAERRIRTPSCAARASAAK